MNWLKEVSRRSGEQQQRWEKERVPRQEVVVDLPIAFEDSRGIIVNILQVPLFDHLAYITCKAGSIRAGHWHPEPNEQVMVLISGRYRAVSQEIDAEGNLIPNTRREQWVEAGQLAACPPRLAHVYYFPVESVFLNLNREPREADGYGKHTIPVDLK